MKPRLPVRRIIALAATAALTAGAVAIGPVTPAQASLACQGTTIWINGGSGAEPGSWATGHSHATGNHYVRRIIGSNWEWWADNNGGSDGDTADTYYGLKSC